jgi:hypothetical protein
MLYLHMVLFPVVILGFHSDIFNFPCFRPCFLLMLNSEFPSEMDFGDGALDQLCVLLIVRIVFSFVERHLVNLL